MRLVSNTQLAPVLFQFNDYVRDYPGTVAMPRGKTLGFGFGFSGGKGIRKVRSGPLENSYA